MSHDGWKYILYDFWPKIYFFKVYNFFYIMKVKITASSLQNPLLKRRKAVEMVACVILQRITVLGVKLSSHFKLIFGGHSQKGHKFCPFFGQKWGGGVGQRHLATLGLGDSSLYNSPRHAAGKSFETNQLAYHWC